MGPAGARGGAEREEQAETEDAAVIGDHETPEPGHGREPVDQYGHHRRPRDQRPAVIPALHEAHHDVQTVLRRGAENQRETEDVAHVECEVEEIHEPERPYEAEGERQERQHRLADPAQCERGGQADQDDRVDRTLLVSALHQVQRFERDDWSPGHVGVDRSEVADEAPRAVAVPDVDRRVDLEEKAPAIADELGSEILRDVGETDRPGHEVPLEPLEAPDEVAVDLILQMRQRRLAHLGIQLADSENQPSDVLDDECELRLGLALRRLVRRDAEAALERFEGGDEPAEVHGCRPAHPDGRDQRGEVPDDLELRGLVLGNEQQHRVHFRDAPERPEGRVLAPKLVERVRAREGRKPGPPCGRQDALLPRDGFGAVGLQVEQVVVEPNILKTPRRDAGQGDRHDRHRLRVGDEPLDERHVDTLERDRARDRTGRPARMAPVHEDERRREHGHHREPGEQEGGARDEAELAHAPEVGEPQDVEGAGRRHGAQQHAWAAARGGDFDRLPEVAAEKQLFLVAEQEVDAVVDADADHDRDEHHREEREVPDHQGRDADRPAEARGEDGDHHHGLADAQERDEHEPEREGEGQHRRTPAVAEGRDHLVVLERGLAGHPDRDVGEVALE